MLNHLETVCFLSLSIRVSFLCGMVFISILGRHLMILILWLFRLDISSHKTLSEENYGIWLKICKDITSTWKFQFVKQQNLLTNLAIERLWELHEWYTRRNTKIFVRTRDVNLRKFLCAVSGHLYLVMGICE